MKKKKLLALFSALMLTVSACGAPTNPSTATPPAQSPTQSSETPKIRETSVDFVVAGGGAGGLSAATEAARQGKSVILVEKLSFTGGSSALCEGYLWACGAKINEETGEGFTAEQMKAFYKESGGNVVNGDLIDNMVDMSAEIFNQIDAAGANFSRENFMTGTKDFNVFIADGAGSGMMTAMREEAEKLGVEIRYESPAVSLIVEDGAVKGITVKDKEGTYNIYAGTTILATGGFLMNEELMQEHLPDWAGLRPMCSVGNTGDGHRMALELGAEMIGDNITGTWGWDGKNGYKMKGGMAPMLSRFYVNEQGKRFTSEIDPLKMRNIVAQPERVAHTLMDSSLPNFIPLLEESVAEGLTVKADTLEDLAKLAGIDPVALQETVDAYNAVQASGGVDEFGVPAAAMAPITTAPYYMSTLSPEIPNATLKGIKVNEFGQILSGDAPIPNLYGAGELILGNIVNDRYPTCGSCLAAGLYVGPVAVRHALGIMK